MDRPIYGRRWLVFWSGLQHRIDCNGTEVVAAYDPRLTPEKVALFLEELHALLQYSIDEQLRWALRGKRRAYRASISASSRGMRVMCGHHPWLEARLCHDVQVVEPSAKRLVRWSEAPVELLGMEGSAN